MAVYCGVCATRITSAPENEGPFQTAGKDFGGWDIDERGRSKISDTCHRCAPVLRAAVEEAARSVTRSFRREIEERKQEVAGWKDRQERIEKVKNEFERDWLEHRTKRGL